MKDLLLESMKELHVVPQYILTFPLWKLICDIDSGIDKPNDKPVINQLNKYITACHRGGNER